ncbi:MAG: N-acetyltransferase [Clostridiales bacterium]|nr:N-acetyltransferase [Clostridiales bacterium]
MQIRKARLEDAAQIQAVYAPYVRNTAITFEYDVPDAEEMGRRIRETAKKYPYLVAEEDGEILGYAYAGPFKGRAAYDWAVETTIYVKPGCRRRGIGKVLYPELEEELKKMHILNACACIAYAEKEDEFLTNDSMRFHEKMGYQFVGRFHQCGYKFGRWYDMIWMEKMLGEHGENPLAVGMPE